MKKRIFSFLCVVMLTLSLFSFASAGGKPVARLRSAAAANQYGYDYEFFTLKNGKTAKFFLLPSETTYLHAKNGVFKDILFDCASAVTAKCGAKWVHISKATGSFVFWVDPNDTAKTRNATIAVTGKNYKATVKLTQYGKSEMTSVVRNKKTVTIKLKMAAGSQGGYLRIYQYKYDKSGRETCITDYVNFAKGKTSVKFKVEAGWYYSVSLFGYYQRGSSENLMEDSTDWVHFQVTKKNINQKETIR